MGTPEQYQQASAQRDYNRNLEAVKLTPMQQGNLMLREAGTQLGQTGMGLLGIQDPVLQKMTMAQQLAGQFDLTDPLGLSDYSKALAKAGAPDLALMALDKSLTLQKTKSAVESAGVKVLSDKADYYAKNPFALDQEIEDARAVGDTTKVTELSGLKVKILDSVNLARQKELASIALLGAQGDAQKAQAKNLLAQAEAGKISVTSVPDKTGGATIIYADKTGKEVNRIVVTNELMQTALGGDKTAGGKPKPLTQDEVNQRLLNPQAATNPAAAPAQPTVAVPNSATVSGAWNDTSKTYDMSKDPDMQKISMVAAQNADRLATDAQFREAIGRAQREREALIKQQYGQMINIKY